jgi:glycosyltransferase involved in cell wall biosynthesis
MKEVFGRSHVIVVPTTTRFVEGFNMVIIEALLASRPVITSRVCPAVEYVEAAVREVPPDDVEAYYVAILGLARDRREYEDLQRRCAPAVEKFQAEELGFAAALRHVFCAIAERREVPPISINP